MEENKEHIWDKKLYKESKIGYYRKYPRHAIDELLIEILDDLYIHRGKNERELNDYLNKLEQKYEDKLNGS